MEDTSEAQKVDCCLSCLCKNDEYKLDTYSVQNEALRAIFQTEQITLCYFCKRVAQQAELFVQNVQSNQILLENFNVITDLTLQTIKSQIHPLLHLTQLSLATIELDGNNDNIEESFSVVYSSKKENELQIKLELKDESELREDLEGEFIDDNDFNTHVKEEEDEYPLKLLKEELELEGVKIKCLRKSTKKGKVKKRERVKKDIDDDGKVREVKIDTIFITRRECMEERAKMAIDKKYINSAFKCEGCIKGFSFKDSYDKHMEKHRESNGSYECDICKQRMATEDKLNSHRRYHSLRHRCGECGLTRISRIAIKDHYTAFHCQGHYQYTCAHCSKVFKRQVSLRKHVGRVHTIKERLQCDYCSKSYLYREGLKMHMLERHPTESDIGGKRIKKHICKECGMAFNAPSLLKNHSIKHSHRRDYYCVECDKSFKSDSILKHHLKTAVPHTKYLELPLLCLHCDKRFAIRRDLDRHMNRIHLNIKPYQCDQCAKAYVDSWALTEHRRNIHEGYKRPLKFPCSMCDKIFDVS